MLFVMICVVCEISLSLGAYRRGHFHEFLVIKKMVVYLLFFSFISLMCINSRNEIEDLYLRPLRI